MAPTAASSRIRAMSAVMIPAMEMSFQVSPTAQDQREGAAAAAGAVKSTTAGPCRVPVAEYAAWSSMPRTSAPPKRATIWKRRRAPDLRAMPSSTGRLWATRMSVARTVIWAWVSGGAPRVMKTMMALYRVFTSAVAQTRPISGGRPTRAMSGARGMAR